MLRFIARRLLEAIPVVLVIITMTFFMQRFIPGGPFTRDRALPPEIEKRINDYYHLNDPLWKQYTSYLGNLAPKKFDLSALNESLDLNAAFGIDFGPSYRYAGRTVNELIADKLPASLQLGAIALGVAILFGIPLGILAALRRNTWLDYLCSSVSMVGICIPTFVIGPLLILLFALHFRQFDASGWDEPRDRVLPGLTLGIVYVAYVARLTRGGMLEVLHQDFIRTARAKGASEARIVFKHALRGGLSPVVAYLGPAAAGILTGSFVVETVFQIPGLGREFVTAATNRDYMMVLGTVTLYAFFIIAFNLIVDVIQVWLNPKLKFE